MSPLPPDPYKILGISKDAQTPEIRSAHRKLVLTCHPDKVKDPTLKAQKQDEFQKVQQAYELLSNDLERQKYDDKVKLEELRKQFQNKANISSPRSSPRYSGQDEARGTESRASPFKVNTSHSSSKYSYSRSSDEDLPRGARIFEAAPRSSRREASYADKPTKRESERERERERDREREREKDKEKDRRRRQEDAIRRAEKDAKDARRAEKRAKEKQRDKEMKRESEEKKRHAKPYIEPYVESFPDEHPVPKPEKRKPTNGKRHEERRERSLGHEDSPTSMPPPPTAPQRSYTADLHYATTYIQASKAKNGAPPGLQRSATYHARPVQPPAPTPPPVAGQPSPFATPDDEVVRRSSARPRRGSGDDTRLPRERSYRGSSREILEDPVIGVSPSSRHAAQFMSPAGSPIMSASPPRADLSRAKMMPHEAASYSRPPASLSRAQTFNVFESGEYPRGRGRSRMQPQVEAESDSEDLYERRRDRKHRGSRRHHSPESMRTETVSRYQVDGSRSKYHGSFTRRLDHPEVVDEPFSYYTRAHEARPSMPVREATYMSSASTPTFPKIKTSKLYGYDDVKYSYYDYGDKPSREDYAAYA